MQMNVTVVIPVKNEASNLVRCIELAKALGPVLVVDSDSTDETQVVSETHGAKVLQFKWNGQFPKKRNWTLRHYTFETDWVLFLDADEFISKAFVEELRAAIENTPHVGFWLNYENYFMGHKLKGGDLFRKLALFRIDAGEYEKIDEDNWSHLDMEVHEHPVLSGSAGEIVTAIEHNDFRGLKHYIAKHNEYSSWEAARYIRLKGRSDSDQSTEEWQKLTDRQRKKYGNLSKWWFAPAYFITSFFVKGGYKDGAHGLHFSLLKCIYFYQVRIKILEKEASR